MPIKSPGLSRLGQVGLQKCQNVKNATFWHFGGIRRGARWPKHKTGFAGNRISFLERGPRFELAPTVYPPGAVDRQKMGQNRFHSRAPGGSPLRLWAIKYMSFSIIFDALGPHLGLKSKGAKKNFDFGI